jgi:hypothetical protein
MGCASSKENKDIFKQFENIEVPHIPFEIIEIFKNDYKFMKKLLEYKRDPTLALLKINNVVIIYDENLNLQLEKNFINFGESSDSFRIPLSQAMQREWCKFYENIKKNYAKKLTEELLNLFNNKYHNNYSLIYEIDEKFLGPIIEKVLDEIYQSFSKIFFFQKEPGKQNDYINIELKDKIDINKNRYYWLFQGIIFAQNTIKYNESIKDNSFKVELNGKPKFQIVALDLNLLNDLKKNKSNLKNIIDIIDDKIIEQNFKNFDI